jgi:hypothetical protein
MALIFVYGAMFGFLALWRKSLRPGMMVHAWHDAFSGRLSFHCRPQGNHPDALTIETDVSPSGRNQE